MIVNSTTSDSDEARLAAASGDYATAVRQWRRLADEGDPIAQFNLGFSYERGQGVARDSAEAAKWYLLAAEQGHADAQYRLGLYCEKEDAKKVKDVVRHGYFEKEDEAGEWYSKAAMQGHADAQIRLAEFALDYAAEIDPYTETTGVGVEDAKERKENASDDAEDWFRMAAEQGHADAQFALGQSYRYSGRRSDASEEDYAVAAKWYRRAAIQGHPSARFSLGTMCSNGEGMPRDLLQAYMWFDLAASCEPNSEHRALIIDMRTAVAQKMAPEQIAEAQRLAPEWKSK